MSGFYAQIHNYITFESSNQVILDGVNFVNTRYARLQGGEAYAELDVTDWLTPFGTLNYVEGRDQTKGSHFDPAFVQPVPFGTQEPLPGIPPLETRLGFRLHDPSRQQNWAIEFTARIVNPQNRIANSLDEFPTAGRG